MDLEALIETAGKVVDGAGVAAMVLGALVSTIWALVELLRKEKGGDALYSSYRRRLGRSILLGLKLLVAADIIRTVAVTPTFTPVGALALVVLIRTLAVAEGAASQ